MTVLSFVAAGLWPRPWLRVPLSRALGVLQLPRNWFTTSDSPTLGSWWPVAKLSCPPLGAALSWARCQLAVVILMLVLPYVAGGLRPRLLAAGLNVRA